MKREVMKKVTIFGRDSAAPLFCWLPSSDKLYVLLEAKFQLLRQACPGSATCLRLRHSLRTRCPRSQGAFPGRSQL